MASRKNKSASPSPVGEGVAKKVSKKAADKTPEVASELDQVLKAPEVKPLGDAVANESTAANPESAPVAEKLPEMTEQVVLAVQPETDDASAEEAETIFTPVVVTLVNNSPSRLNIANIVIGSGATETVEVTTEKRLHRIEKCVEQLNSLSRKSGWGERITLSKI